MSMQRVGSILENIDQGLVSLMANYGIPLVRISLGVVFVWFGLLKVVGVSPVSDLVAQTAYWFPPSFFVPFLGLWETIVGLLLLLSWALRIALLLFWVQLAGTFLVLILRPEVAFQTSNPLLLTMQGEFVIKNIVLIAAGLVVGSTVRSRQRKIAAKR